ncbi:MAG TPA: O-antigen ligase family protein [Gemmatimonadaceae bacterium]|nr:O-antigen ligase family protein [Gemmatimonadaceae bacterium]
MTRLRSAAEWRVAILVLSMAALLVPVIAPSGFFFPYVFPRNIFFRIIVETGTLVLVWSICLGDDDLDLRFEPIFWAIAAFVLAGLVSALFSPARDHSLFGDFERMGGVWAWLHLALFFLLLRALREHEWKWVLNCALIVSLAVSTVAIWQHFHFTSAVDAVGAQFAASDSTIGNSGLLAVYLLFGLGIAAYLATTAARLRSAYFAAAGVVSFGMVYAENRSSVVGMILGALAGSILFAILRSKQKRWLAPSIALGIACIVVSAAAAIRAFPGTALVRVTPTVVQRLALSDPSGVDELRLMHWHAALQGFEDRPVFGYGPENYNLVWSAHLNPAIYRLDTDVYDHAHNEYLEILATGGVIGLCAFVGIWLAIGVTLSRAYRDERLSSASLAVLVALQVAYAVYLIFWFFDLNSTMLWILVGAFIASRENAHGIVQAAVSKTPQHKRVGFAIAVVSAALVGVSLYSEALLPTRVNRALAQLDSPPTTVASLRATFATLAANPIHESPHTPIMMADYLDGARPEFATLRRNPTGRRMLESSLADALSTFKAEIHRDTLNDRLYTREASVLLDAAEFYNSPAYVDTAIDVLHKAIELSPRRIQPRMLLARLYTEDRDFDGAKAVLEAAIRIDPDIGEPRYRMAEHYLRFGQTDSAFYMLRSSLRRGYVGPPETYLAVGKRLEFSRRSTEAADLYTSYLEAKYTKAIWDAGSTIDRAVPPADIAVAAHLPLLYVRAQERELAIKSAAALSAFDSTRTDLVEQFVTDLGSRRRSRWLARNSLLPCVTSRASRSTMPDKLEACGVFRKKL